jgi:hypothetical protein
MTPMPRSLVRVAFAFVVLSSALAVAQDSEPVDITLPSMRGGDVTLSSHRGSRVVVLFYEDRPHVEDNDALKGEIGRYIVDNHLEERMVSYGVANLGDVGMVPEALVRSMISPLVDRWGSDILLDWEGAMRRAPFDFETYATNVAIVDRGGRIVWRHVGVVDGENRTAFFRALRRALAAP